MQDGIEDNEDEDDYQLTIEEEEKLNTIRRLKNMPKSMNRSNLPTSRMPKSIKH